MPVENRSPAVPRLYDYSGTELPLNVPPPIDQPFIFPENVQNRYRDYPSRDLTPGKLSTYLDEADAGDPGNLIQLEEEILEKDTKIGSVFQTRLSAVMGTPRELMPADESEEARTIADFVETAMEIANEDEMRQNQLDAIPKPFAVSHVEWGLMDVPGFGMRNVPVHFTPLNQRNFRWAIDRDQLLYVPDRKKPKEAFPLQPYTTIRSLFLTRRDHPTRLGLLRPICWLYLFKSYGVKDWASWTDRFGMPVRVLKIAREDMKDLDLMAEIRAALRRLGADASGIFPIDAELDIRETVSGAPVFQQWIEFIDRAIAQAVLGHELSSQATQTGNYGVSAAKDVRQDILESDCELITADVHRDIYIPLVGWNFGWDKIHLTPWDWYKFEESVDLQQRANVVSAIGKTFPDLAFSRQHLREEFNLPPPAGTEELEDEDDAIFPKAPSAGFGGFGGGGFGEPSAPAPPAEEPTNNLPMRRVAKSTRPSNKLAAQVLKRATRRRRIELSSAVLQTIARAGVTDAAPDFERMRTTIRKVITRGVEDGWSAQRAVREVARLYPYLTTETAERAAREKLVLSRMFGRKEGRKAVKEA